MKLFEQTTVQRLYHIVKTDGGCITLPCIGCPLREEGREDEFRQCESPIYATEAAQNRKAKAIIKLEELGRYDVIVDLNL